MSELALTGLNDSTMENLRKMARLSSVLYMTKMEFCRELITIEKCETLIHFDAKSITLAYVWWDEFVKRQLSNTVVIYNSKRLISLRDLQKANQVRKSFLRRQQLTYGGKR